MKKLAYSLAFTCLVMGSGASARTLNDLLPVHPATSSLFASSDDKAIITRTEDDGALTFRFSAASSPDEVTFETAMARYRSIPGFKDLQLGPDQTVVLTTEKTISAEHLQKLLLSSTRLYGHIGFEFKA